jgi:small conductance mechanosensitive channel
VALTPGGFFVFDQILQSLDLSALATRAIAHIPSVIAGLIIFVALWSLFRLMRYPAKRALERAGLAPALIRLLVDSLLRYTIMAFALIMALDQFGINVAAALAGLGIAGVAIGFAAQDSVANVISGFLIFLDRPFRTGDWVEVAGHSGTVVEITLRSTRIRTPSNTFVVIPNKTIINEVLVNHSKNGDLRLNVPIGIAYKEYIPQAREVLLRAVSTLEPVLKDPAPTVVVLECGDSSVNLEIRAWIPDANLQVPIGAAVIEAAKLALDEAGIEIPFPHLQLFIDDVRRPVWEGLTALNRQGRPNA